VKSTRPWRSAGAFVIARRHVSDALEPIAWANLGEGTSAHISGDGEGLYIVADETGEEIILPLTELTLVATDEGLELRLSGRPILLVRSIGQADWPPLVGRWVFSLLGKPYPWQAGHSPAVHPTCPFGIFFVEDVEQRRVPTCDSA